LPHRTVIVSPLYPTRTIEWRGGRAASGERILAEETPVAFTYNRTTHAVMLATPADLEDFAVGFSLTEGVIGAASDILALDVVEVSEGVELRMDLAPARLAGLEARRRRLAGFGGCGLCGMESLTQVLRPLPKRSGDPAEWRVQAAILAEAMAALPAMQALNRQARALHAAAFLNPTDGIMAVAEDVGRHNALDKLAGMLMRRGIDAARGAVLLSSRVSVELVQKTARIGAPLLVAVSAPTALALRVAQDAGITVVGVARADGFEVFTHPGRVVGAAASE
jgi:FdhD protein